MPPVRQTFYLQLVQQRIRFHASGFFDMNLRLLASVCAVCGYQSHSSLLPRIQTDRLAANSIVSHIRIQTHTHTHRYLPSLRHTS